MAKTHAKVPSWEPKRVLKCPSFRPCPSKSLCTPLGFSAVFSTINRSKVDKTAVRVYYILWQSTKSVWLILCNRYRTRLIHFIPSVIIQHEADLQSKNTNNADDLPRYLSVSSLWHQGTELHIRRIKVVSSRGSWWSRKCQNCQINELPVSLCDFMFTPSGLFIKRRCEQEPDQN